MRTGLVFHELYLWHHTGNHADYVPYGFPVEPLQHVESPETKRRIKNLLEVTGLLEKLVPIKPRKATREEILLFHTENHFEHIKSLNETINVNAGISAPTGIGSFDIALLSTGGVLEAMDRVIDGKVNNAYALVRPPGHHAIPDRAMGFCLFGNAAIAGKHALSKRGLSKIAYVDWDVHHGNGTQAAFYDDPSALTISIHQDRNFPTNSGLMNENGEGKGSGYNINIPLPPGSGVGAYEAAFDRVIIPAIEKFMPELIVIPSGFDGGAGDPIGRQMMTSVGFRSLTQKMMKVAEETCDGKILMTHEGGYSAATVPFFAHAVIETLAKENLGIEDPFQRIIGSLGQQDLQPHQDQLIKEAEQLVKNIK
ncbi:MAG: class II histone deacetylase [Gammaproteobacteria bacterium]|nr:class II histone deacetylase [Gammaproteobacteria bacterium]HJL95769.1 class II histone deacetylase [SAR86 cluster bacterium]|tara:strand:- start:4212 stop:5312 length:1101 start_codon:yes stop_codon:yes gene_type:complete